MVYEWITNKDAPEIWGCPEYNTREGAIRGGLCEFDGDFYIAKAEPYIPMVDAYTVIEQVRKAACWHVGEAAEDWLAYPDDTSVSEDLRERLQEAFDQWCVDTDNKPSFFKVTDVELIERTKWERMKTGNDWTGWVSPKGELFPCPTLEHRFLAREIVDKRLEAVPEYLFDPEKYLEEQGWAKAMSRNYESCFTPEAIGFAKPLTKKQMKTLAEIGRWSEALDHKNSLYRAMEIKKNREGAA